MYLKLSELKVPMKLVFDLREELKRDPERVATTRALTVDTSRPWLGLKGNRGLFGSDEWWRNIDEGKMPTLHYAGIVLDAFVAGQDPSDYNNTIELRLSDGSTKHVGIYALDWNDRDLFKVGCWAEIIYALDDLKRPNAFESYSKVALEMAVSLQPVIASHAVKD